LSYSDRNIARICKRHPHLAQVPTSALAECYLRKLHKDGIISYDVGDDDFITRKDQEEAGSPVTLKPVDAQIASRLDKLKDLLLRHGSTGVQDAIQTAVSMLGYFVVYPVSNLNNFTCGDESTPYASFRDAFLVPPRITVRGLADELWRVTQFISAEGLGPNNSTRQLSEEDVLSSENNVIKYVVKAIPRMDPNSTS
jgi:ribosome-binding ATPase